MVVSSKHFPLRVEHLQKWGLIVSRKVTIRFSSDPDGVYDQVVTGYAPLSRPPARWYREYKTPLPALVSPAAAGME